MDLKDQTPPQIDTKLADLYAKEVPHLSRIQILNESLKRARAQGAPLYLTGRISEMEAELVQQSAALKRLAAQIAPYEAEYARRPWKRYFLVTDGGHVHRGRNCSTCYATTQYGWLPELSGCDEAEMVREYGETACTVCFPDAPSMWKAMGSPQGKLAREVAAKRAERDAKRAASAVKKAANTLVEPIKPRGYLSISTVSEAYRELTDAAGVILANAVKPLPNQDYVVERAEGFEIIAAALARKTGRPVEDIRAEAERKAKKRGY